MRNLARKVYPPACLPVSVGAAGPRRLVLACAVAHPCCPSPPPNLVPLAPPMDSLERAADAAAHLPRAHSLLVSWRGELILERYFNGTRAARLANIKSASKSVISALVGVAVDRGLITGVKQPISAFFPDLLREQRRCPQEGHHHRRSADHALRTGDHQQPQLRRLGAESELGALRAQSSAARSAGHDHGVQHGQYALAVRHPDQGHREEHVAIRAGNASPSRWASNWRSGLAIRKASISAATTCS